MTRSRLANPLGRWGLLLLLAVGGGQAGYAPARAQAPQPVPVARVPDSATASTAPAAPAPAEELPAAPAPVAPASNWPWVLGVLAGIALGVLGARWWTRKPRPASGPDVAAPERIQKKPEKLAENVVIRSASQSSRPGHGGSAAAPPPKPSPKTPGTGGKPKHKPKNPPSTGRSESWPANVPHRAAAMNPTPPAPPVSPDQLLETGQTVEWTAAPTIHELIDTTANEVPIDRDARVESLEALEAAAAANAPSSPLQFYGPAPDVPSIDHRKLSPNPLPQMPLLVTLANSEASTAQFSFSPQADQSRVIGNGVQELKEFFAFELPLDKEFTTIQNLKPGKLEKREDTWHVVEKAGIALS